VEREQLILTAPSPRVRVFSEWRQQIDELRWHRPSWDLGDIDGIAMSAQAKVKSPLDATPPELLAVRNGFAPIEDPYLGSPAVLDGLLIRYRPDANRRREGGAITHESAEGLALGKGMLHVDIQILTIMLPFPRWEVARAVARFGATRAAALLAQRQRHVPAFWARRRVGFFLEERAAQQMRLPGFDDVVSSYGL
jgi:hypothetical protein